MRNVCLLAIVILAAAGCGAGEKSTGNVSWTRIVALVRECKVKAVDQTHESRIDAIGHVVNRAYRRCGPITYSTE
jgi:hypothetical protein